MRNRWWTPGMLAAAALTAAACGTSSAAGPVTASRAPGAAASVPAAGRPVSAIVKAANISGETVLTSAKGFTLYWFAPDTTAKSNCNGSCAQYWPPVQGPVTAGLGVTGRLGTIRRSDGAAQATYDGHPLYTYVADRAPGQATGNGLNSSGGGWHQVTLPGAAGPAPPASASRSSSGGSGY